MDSHNETLLMPILCKVQKWALDNKWMIRYNPCLLQVEEINK